MEKQGQRPMSPSISVSAQPYQPQSQFQNQNQQPILRHQPNEPQNAFQQPQQNQFNPQAFQHGQTPYQPQQTPQYPQQPFQPQQHAPQPQQFTPQPQYPQQFAQPQQPIQTPQYTPQQPQYNAPTAQSPFQPQSPPYYQTPVSPPQYQGAPQQPVQPHVAPNQQHPYYNPTPQQNSQPFVPNQNLAPVQYPNQHPVQPYEAPRNPQINQQQAPVQQYPQTAPQNNPYYQNPQLVQQAPQTVGNYPYQLAPQQQYHQTPAQNTLEAQHNQTPAQNTQEAQHNQEEVKYPGYKPQIHQNYIQKPESTKNFNQNQQVFQPAVQNYAKDEIEPTETDIFVDGADMDEGTINAYNKQHAPTQNKKQKTPAPRENSPKLKVAKTPIDEFNNQAFADSRSQQTNRPVEKQGKEDWYTIKQKIDQEYEKKLKEVGEDAMKKLKIYQQEHKALLEKTQYLIDNDEPEEQEKPDYFEAPQSITSPYRQKANTQYYAPQRQPISDPKYSAKGPQRSLPQNQYMPIKSPTNQNRKLPVQQDYEPQSYQKYEPRNIQQSAPYQKQNLFNQQKYEEPYEPVQTPQYAQNVKPTNRYDQEQNYEPLSPRSQKPQLQGRSVSPIERPLPQSEQNYKQAQKDQVSFGKNQTAQKNLPRPSLRPDQEARYEPQYQHQRPVVTKQDPEPLFVLKVELDDGANVQYIKVYEGQQPEEIVEDFGRKFNLSENAKVRLSHQIRQQIQN